MPTFFSVLVSLGTKNSSQNISIERTRFKTLNFMKNERTKLFKDLSEVTVITDELAPRIRKLQSRIEHNPISCSVKKSLIPFFD